MAFAVLLFVATAFLLAYFQPPPREEGSEIDALRYAVAAASYAAARGVSEAVRHRVRFPFSRSRLSGRHADAAALPGPAEHQAVSTAAPTEPEPADKGSKRGFGGVLSAGDRQRVLARVVGSPASDCEGFLRQVRSQPVRLLHDRPR